MPRPATPVVLDDAQRSDLVGLARSRTLPQVGVYVKTVEVREALVAAGLSGYSGNVSICETGRSPMAAPRDIDVLIGQRDALLGSWPGWTTFGRARCRRATAGAASRPATARARAIRGTGPSGCWCRASRARNWTIPNEAVQRTREHLDECRRLRELTRELIAVGDELCQARLEGDAPGHRERGGGRARVRGAGSEALDAEAGGRSGTGCWTGSASSGWNAPAAGSPCRRWAGRWRRG